MEGDFPVLLDLFQTVGMWAPFLFLFLQERKAHDLTRAAHMQDLRDIALLSERDRSPARREEN